MSIVTPLLLSVAHATEFDVGAGFEFTGYARPGALEAGVAQAELDARLSIAALRLRLDVDLLGPGPFGQEQRVGKGGLSAFPEWGAVMMSTQTGWMLATGFQPHPTLGEAVDGWSNRLVPYTHGFTELWPGYMLGIRGQASALDGALVTSVWGGAVSGEGLAIGAPLLGGSLVLGDIEPFEARAAVTALPTERAVLASVGGRVTLREAAAIGADAWLGFGGGNRATLATTLELFPNSALVPVGRLELCSGVGSPYVVDAGVDWRPFEALRVKLSGRLDGQETWMFAGISLMDDVEPGPGWSFR